jgi:hypothetical protein
VRDLWAVTIQINEGQEAMKINQEWVDAVGQARNQLSARGLTESDEQVLLALAASADETGQVFRGEYDVAVRLTGFSWAAVEFSFQRLQRAGFIKLMRPHYQMGTHYQIVVGPDPIIEDIRGADQKLPPTMRVRQLYTTDHRDEGETEDHNAD